MARENPLLTLGISKAVLVHEHTFGTVEGLLKLMEANYRTLSKRYHPDLPTGNRVLMSELSGAMDELRDPDVLDFYVEELVGEEDIERVHESRVVGGLVARDTTALEYVAMGYDFINQFGALGISQPTTFLTDLTGQRLVIDILSPDVSRASLTDLEYGAENVVHGGYDFETEYRDGRWHEASVTVDYSLKWTPMDRFCSVENVKAVGFVRRPTSDKTTLESSTSMLDSSTRGAKLDWLPPQDCWFLPELRFGEEFPLDDLGDALYVVLYNGGRFAVTGSVLGKAFITE